MSNTVLVCALLCLIPDMTRAKAIRPLLLISMFFDVGVLHVVSKQQEVSMLQLVSTLQETGMLQLVSTLFDKVSCS